MIKVSVRVIHTNLSICHNLTGNLSYHVVRYDNLYAVQFEAHLHRNSQDYIIPIMPQFFFGINPFGPHEYE